MKTENTLENKAKFFALYWGQKVIHYHASHKSFPMVVQSNTILISREESGYLTLTPLSQITDEDALECYKIHFKGHLDKDIRPDESRINFSKKYIIKPIEVCVLEVTDYLRSKGYALLWMGLSEQDLIDYGWIKLKQNENY